MPAPRKYPDELREGRSASCSTRRTSGQRHGGVPAIGDELGINKDTLRGWVKRGPDRLRKAAGHVKPSKDPHETCHPRCRPGTVASIHLNPNLRPIVKTCE
jgi:hypothetical protein